MATYSFLDVIAAIDGPGGNFSIGSGAGVAEEGITVELTEDKNAMLIGADGQGQHSLHAGKSGRIVLRLLKTSPTNALLNAMYNFQTLSAANHGGNTILVRDVVRGDVCSAQEAAFQKLPNVTYSKDGEIIEWSWHAIKIDIMLGTGTPVSAV